MPTTKKDTAKKRLHALDTLGVELVPPPRWVPARKRLSNVESPISNQSNQFNQSKSKSTFLSSRVNYIQKIREGFVYTVFIIQDRPCA